MKEYEYTEYTMIEDRKAEPRFSFSWSSHPYLFFIPTVFSFRYTTSFEILKYMLLMPVAIGLDTLWLILQLSGWVLKQSFLKLFKFIFFVLQEMFRFTLDVSLKFLSPILWIAGILTALFLIIYFKIIQLLFF